MKSYDVFRDGEFLVRRESMRSTPAEARKEFIAHGFDTNIQVRPGLSVVTPPQSKNYNERGHKLQNWERQRPPVRLTTS